MGNRPREVEKTRISVTLTRPYLDALDHLVAEGVYLSRGEAVLEGLRKWQVRSHVHSYTDRNLAQAMAELDRLSDKLHIPPTIKEKAAIIYRKALKQGLVRGRSISTIAAALYIACQMSNEKRTQKMIADAAGVTEVTIRNRYKGLKDILEPEVPSGRPRTRQDGVRTWEKQGLEVDQVIGAGAQVEG